jgi:hypothetical protein
MGPTVGPTVDLLTEENLLFLATEVAMVLLVKYASNLQIEELLKEACCGLIQPLITKKNINYAATINYLFYTENK